MFIVIYIPHLLRYYLCFAYRGVNVGMLVSINPYIDATVGNIVAKFCSIGSV